MESKVRVPVDAYMDIFKHPYKYAVHPFKIFGNIYYIGNSNVSSHLIDTGDGLILIDTTYPHTFPLLVNSIWEAGFSIYDVKYILHSHGHFDHFGGTVPLAALTKAKTFLGALDARMFRECPDMTLGMDSPHCHLELFTPDVEMEDGQIITLGNTEIRAVLTPGHSPGVMSFFFKVTDGNETYTAAMQGGAGLITLGMRYYTTFNIDPVGPRKSFLEGIKKIENEKVDIPLGNHPSFNKTLEKREKMLANPNGPNPFIDPSEWQSFLSDVKLRFEKMLAEEAGTV